MSCLADGHRAQCGLCDKFNQRERVDRKDFDSLAESLAVACPYYQLEQGLVSVLLDSEVRQWRREVSWIPAPWNENSYMLEVEPCDYHHEYWDVYLEPGSITLPGLDCVPEPGTFHHSPEAFAFIEHCRRVCETEHLSCQNSNTERILPPRLLKVEEHRLVLVETDGLPNDISYVALSYCWGKGNSLCTTKSTISEFRDGIDLHVVPAALLDAAEICRKLEEQYIWIDRLCIQQDDSADWQQHALIMARIYEQAELTIAAVTSASVHDSFLRPDNAKLREDRDSLVVPWPDRVRNEFGDIRVRVRSKLSDMIYDSSMEPYRYLPESPRPLGIRGWTYQERYLAQRSVRYEAHQIVWECPTAQYLEKFPFDTLQPAARHDWQRSVADFSLRCLTYATDRSAAISGLASRHNRLSGETYLAGLWENDAVLSQLLWEPNIPQIHLENSGLKFCDAHSMSNAPSWSWLSVSQPVSWQIHQYNDSNFPNLKILEINVKSSGPNIFGDVVSPARFVLEAKMLDATLTCRQQDPSSKTHPKYKCTIGHNGRSHSVNDFIPDTHLELFTAEGESRWARKLTSVAKYLRPGTHAPVKILSIEPAKRKKLDSRNYSFALILSAVMDMRRHTVPSYERIGHVYISDGDGRMHGATARAKSETFCIV